MSGAFYRRHKGQNLNPSIVRVNCPSIAKAYYNTDLNIMMSFVNAWIVILWESIQVLYKVEQPDGLQHNGMKWKCVCRNMAARGSFVNTWKHLPLKIRKHTPLRVRSSGRASAGIPRVVINGKITQKLTRRQRHKKWRLHGLKWHNMLSLTLMGPAIGQGP